MQANCSSSVIRQHAIRVLVLCFVLMGLSILTSLAARGRGSEKGNEIKLSVKDPRPVAEAILKLEEKYGWVVTYEDPRYVHDSEIINVTLKVRNDLDKYKPGQAPKVLIPKGGTLEFTYDVAPNTNLPVDSAMVVQKLLAAQAVSSNGGKFRLINGGKILHVIPTAIKNSRGELVPQESVLDTIISLPAEERTIEQKLRSICATLSRTTNIRFEVGTIPTPWFQKDLDRRGAASQRAREVLVKTFESMDGGTSLSWRLLYSPDSKSYYLNVHLVSRRSS